MSLHLYLITTGSCLLIGLSSMISLFLFSRLFLSASPRKSQAPSRNGSVVTNNTKFDTFDPNKSEGLKRVLSFAVGCLLGDVFLHLLPEASTQLERNGYSYFERLQYLTTWIALGGIFFCALESLSMLHDGNDGNMVNIGAEDNKLIFFLCSQSQRRRQRIRNQSRAIR